MRISTVPNATPHSTPPSRRGTREGREFQTGEEQYIWTTLVPRLVNPAKLAIIEALIGAGRPLSIDDLLPLMPPLDASREVVSCYVASMVEAGTLEEIPTQVKAEDEPPCFYLASPG